MFDLDILHEMIKDTVKLPLKDHYGKYQIELTEPQRPSSSVTIYGLPDATIAIRVDAFQSPKTVFRNTRGECKRADFVVFANTSRKRVILYIAMKATKGSEEEIKQQLKGAQCFMAYCREIGRVFWGKRDFLDDYVERFISIGHTSIAKKPTRMPPITGVHDRPDRMMKISSPHYLHFDQLAA
ncbi:MAG: hypothetical protein WBD79_15770 [Anaerolineae bacterium]